MCSVGTESRGGEGRPAPRQRGCQEGRNPNLPRGGLSAEEPATVITEYSGHKGTRTVAPAAALAKDCLQLKKVGGETRTWSKASNLEQTPALAVVSFPAFADGGQGNREAGRIPLPQSKKGPWGAAKPGGLPFLEDAEAPTEKGGLQNSRPQELELWNARYISPGLQN